MQEGKKTLLAGRGYLAALVAIVAAGALLRLWGLDTQSLWNDELSSWHRANYESLSEVIEHAKNDIHPPGYHVLTWWVLQIFGDSEIALRFPSAVFGILSILLIWFLGTRLFTKKEGIISAAFMALFWFPVHYSQEARAYSALLFFAIASATCWWYLLRSMREKSRPSPGWTAGYMISAIACAYLHYFGLLLVAMQGIGLALALAKKPKLIVYAALVYVPLALIYLPWVPVFFDSLQAGGATWLEAPGGGDFLQVLYYFFGKSEILKHLALVIFLLPICLWIFRRWKKRERQNGNSESPVRDSPVRLLLVWWLVPYLLAFAVSLAGLELWLPRSLIIVLPPVYLLLARAITTLPWHRLQPWIAVILLVVSLADMLFIRDYYTAPHKQQFREATRYASKSNVARDDCLIVAFVWQRDYLNYYFKKYDSDLRVDLVAGRKEDIPRLKKRIARSHPSTVLFIHAHRVPDEVFVNFMKKKFALKKQKKFLGAGIWVFRGPSP